MFKCLIRTFKLIIFSFIIFWWILRKKIRNRKFTAVSKCSQATYVSNAARRNSTRNVSQTYSYKRNFWRSRYSDFEEKWEANKKWRVAKFGRVQKMETVTVYFSPFRHNISTWNFQVHVNNLKGGYKIRQ